MLIATPVASAAPPVCFGERATIVGTSGDDRLRGTNHRDVIVGRAGDDRIDALSGNDLVCAGRGADRVSGGRGADRVAAGRGDDFGGVGPGDDVVRAGAGADYFFGGGGADRLHGGAGHDGVDGGGGDDRLDGGTGRSDYADYTFAPRPVDANLLTGAATGWGSDTLIGIESLTGGIGADRLVGDARSNLLDGQAGADQIEGQGGGDFLYGQLGNDSLDGGLGSDFCQGESVLNCEPFEQGGTVPAGSYTTSRFRAPFSYSVGGGWQTFGSFPNVFALIRGFDRPPGQTKFLSFLRVRRVYASRSGTVRQAPADLIAWLRAHPRLRAGEPVPVTVGGASGFRIDARVVSTNADCFGLRCFRLFHFNSANGGTYFLLRRERVRFIVLTVNGTKVTIVIEAHRQRFPTFLAAANSVLATVSFSGT